MTTPDDRPTAPVPPTGGPGAPPPAAAPSAPPPPPGPPAPAPVTLAAPGPRPTLRERLTPHALLAAVLAAVVGGLVGGSLGFGSGVLVGRATDDRGGAWQDARPDPRGPHERGDQGPAPRGLREAPPSGRGGFAPGDA